MQDTLVVESTPKASFISRSVASNDEKLDALSKEIEALEKGNVRQEEEVVEETKPEEVEEKPKGQSAKDNWQKRYSDLRSHSAKKEAELQKQIDQLKKSLEERTATELPKSREEVEAWMKKFPQVANIVKVIARDEATEESKNTVQRLQELENMKSELAKERAQQELARRHPDLDDIMSSEQFIEWADAAPTWVQKALFEDLDVDSAASAIDLYKAKHNIKLKNPEKEAALSVSTKAKPQVDDEGKGKYKFRESEIAKMSSAEYLKYEDEINKALIEGKIMYDLTKR